MSTTTAKRRRRAYARAGLYGMRRRMPEVLDRARDEQVADEELSALERGARALRLELLEDSGGAEDATAARRILVEAIVGSALTLGTVDKFLLEELGGSLIDRRSQKVRRVALDREKIAGGLVRMLAQLGIHRRQPTLEQYLERLANAGGRDGAPAAEGTPPRALEGPSDENAADPVALAADDSSEGSREAS